MADNWRVELKGLNEARKANDENLRNLVGGPMVNAMRTATMLVAGAARHNAKADTGRWRASILPEVEAHGTQVVGIVGSVLDYGPFIHFGRGPGKAPPVSAILAWVHHKGIGGTRQVVKGRTRLVKRASRSEELAIAFRIARSIGKKGMKGDKAIYRGFDENISTIHRIIETAAYRGLR